MKRKYDPPLAVLARIHGVSRQRIWQLVRQAEGKCSQCTKPLARYTVLCDSCMIKHRVMVRARVGSNAWKFGGRGRKPLIGD